MKRAGNLLTSGLFFGFGVVLLNGCAGTATVTQPAAQNAPLQLEAAKQPAPVAAPLAGKVVETMNAGSYTYISLEKDGKKGWVAVPATEVAVGQEIKVKPGMEMGKFTSKSLNRTFENILFSPGLVSETNAKAPQGQPPQLPPGHPPMETKPQGGQEKSTQDAKVQSKGHMGMMSQSGKKMAALSGKVVETMDSGGYTYICLENGGKNVWAAVPTMIVSVGQELKLQPGQEMFNFKSKSLNRTFDSVIFSAGALPATK